MLFCIQIIYSSLDTYVFLFNQGKFNPSVGDSFMSDHQILKRKRRKYIVESDTDEDDEMVDLENEEIKDKSSTKSIKEKKLEAFLATGERLCRWINNIDKIIASKMIEGEINEKKGEINDQKIDEQQHVNNEVQTMFSVFSIIVLVKFTLFFCDSG
jgi:hypothetical protein